MVPECPATATISRISHLSSLISLLSLVSDPTLFSRSAEPLAALMRPTTLDDFLGQEQLLGEGKPLRELIRRGEIGSCIFWDHRAQGRRPSRASSPTTPTGSSSRS